MSERSLKSRVAAAAEEALARQGFVTPIDVCLRLGWLHDSDVDDLEYYLPVHDDRRTSVLAVWA